MKLSKAGNVEIQSLKKEEYMEKINQYTRRNLTEEDVYIFSVVLCDNEIDRDGEAFMKSTLAGFAPLFTGKTMVVDHRPSAENQLARIFHAETQEASANEAETAYGEPYVQLLALAYIPKTESSAEVIENIDTGIWKEVSVGCSVEEMVCSICGKNYASGDCAHRKGNTYDGELCFVELRGAKDAYEVSFVAVPAQRRAGVAKSGIRNRNKGLMEFSKIIKELSIKVKEMMENPEDLDEDFEDPPDLEEIEKLVNETMELVNKTKGEQ